MNRGRYQKIFVACLLVLVSGYIYDEFFFASCVPVTIKYPYSTTEDSSLYSYESYTKRIGIDGLKTVCTNRVRGVVSTTIVREPVTDLEVKGTKIYSFTPIYYTTSYGSTCRDGTWSPSTGRGTCSWHGGVAY